jgi:hypothetical protein
MLQLRILNNKGEFLDDKKNYKAIEEMTKDDLLRIVKAVYTDESNTFDPYEEGTIFNKAQDIIYKNVSSKLSDINVNREQITSDIKDIYKDAIAKYR